MAFLTFKSLTIPFREMHIHAKWYKKLWYANNSGALNSSLVSSIAKYKNMEKKYLENQVSYLTH